MTTDNRNEESSQERPDQRRLSIRGNVDNSPIVVGDRNTIHQGSSYSTTNVFSPVSVAPTTSVPSQPLSKQEYRWRQVLVDNVKHYWIEGVLEKSLHNQALIELGLEERSKAVASPLSGVGEFPDEPGRTLPEGTQATDVFDGLGAGRTLLILGEPGAGKTTTLLKLAQSLLERIGDGLSQPIPVILNLSSWSKKRQAIAEWLVQDLYETFQVSKALGKTWIGEEQLVLCLDGLDEVEAKHRNACVEALNQFIQEHGRTELVVCSRVKDYEALSERLRLRSAIYVQPLTPEQVDNYLAQAGEQLVALRAVLNQNAEIKEFARSPLILSVMSLVYQNYSLDEFPELSSAKVFRQQLFGAYVRRMLERRNSKTHQYSNEQTQRWLIWIARRMVKSSKTIFLIERLQPSLLTTKVQQYQYLLVSGLFVGLAVSCVKVLQALGTLAIGLGILYIQQGQYLRLNELVDIGSLLLEMFLGGLMDGLIWGATVVIGLKLLRDIKAVEILKWSWRESKLTATYGFILGLAGGFLWEFIEILIGRVTVNASVEWWHTVSFLFFLVLLEGLGWGLTLGLMGGLFGGLRGPAMQRIVQPNQGIRKSAQNAAILAVIGLIGGWLGLIFLGPVSAGLVAGSIGGGIACLQHFFLRLTLYRTGNIPWNYARFLDYATERLFLQKVGGGYIFIHRMLLEHFAQMELEEG